VASLVDVTGVAAAAKPGGSPTSTAVSGNSCHGVFSGNPPGTLVETTSAGVSGNTFTPGETVTATLTWNPGDFGGSPPAKTDLCVKIGSQISGTLSEEHKPGPSGGTDSYTFKMPYGTGGQPVCVRTAVSGPITSTEKSAVLCYTDLPVATPEVPQALLLPVVGLLVAGGAVLVSRRRRTRTNGVDLPLTE
jgi:hypothetical protein